MILCTLIFLLRCVVLLCDSNEDYADGGEKNSERPFQPTQSNIDNMLQSQLLNGDRVFSYTTKNSYRVYTEDDKNKDNPQMPLLPEDTGNKFQSQQMEQAVQSKLPPQSAEQHVEGTSQSNPSKPPVTEEKFSLQPTKNLIKAKYFPLQKTLQQAVEINPASQFVKQEEKQDFKIMKPNVDQNEIPQPVKTTNKNTFHSCPPNSECNPNFSESRPQLPPQNPCHNGNCQNPQTDEGELSLDSSGQNVDNSIPEPDQPLQEKCQLCPTNIKQNTKAKSQSDDEEEDSANRFGCQGNRCQFHPVNNKQNVANSQLEDERSKFAMMFDDHKNVDHSHQTNYKQDADKLHFQSEEQGINNKPPLEFDQITEDKSQLQSQQQNQKNFQTNYKQNDANAFHSQSKEQNLGSQSQSHIEQFNEYRSQFQPSKDKNLNQQTNNKQDPDNSSLPEDQQIEETPQIQSPVKTAKHQFRYHAKQEQNKNRIEAYPGGDDTEDDTELEGNEEFNRKSMQRRVKNKYRTQSARRDDDIEDEVDYQSTRRSQPLENNEDLVQNEASKGYVEMGSSPRTAEEFFQNKFISHFANRMLENDDHPLTERSNFTDNSPPTYSTERSVQCVTDPEFDFSYADDPTGPYNWSTMFRECDGSKQSPINIDTSELQTMRTAPLRWSSGYFSVPKRMTLENTGHELVLRACFPSGCVPKLSGGPLHKTYKFHSINFHWGMNDLKGSEHTIDEMAYPMEMHVVHTCGSEEIGKNIVIVSYFFQIANAEPDTIESILEVFLRAIKNPKRPIKLRHPFNLAMLVQPFFSEYITYSGSITIPPCTQGVKWIVYPYPLDISREQLEKFRTVCKYAPKLKNNFRPVQPVNNRRVCFVA